MAEKSGFTRKARNMGLSFPGNTGKLNSITDVEGVEVGHVTLIKDLENSQQKKCIRTGITSIFPRGKKFDPVFAGWYALNGNGEMTGTTWITESGFLETPVLLTNTNSVGVCRDAMLKWFIQKNWFEAQNYWYTYPVVAETYDGVLNDINGFHIKEHHVFDALNKAKNGPVEEGNVGAGTGTICMGFKGGIGSSSRVIKIEDKTFTLGTLVQTNFGARDLFRINGLDIGSHLMDTLLPVYSTKATKVRNPGEGSIIVIIATDAPLLPQQLNRICKRIPMGISRIGGQGENGSGDLFLAFSTANPEAFSRNGISKADYLPNDQLDPLFDACIQAVEEAIVNSLFLAKTMTGNKGSKIYSVPVDKIKKILGKSAGNEINSK